jgi:hypothetical protein
MKISEENQRGLEKNLLECHFIYHSSCTKSPGIEHVALRWKPTSNWAIARHCHHQLNSVFIFICATLKAQWPVMNGAQVKKQKQTYDVNKAMFII